MRYEGPGIPSTIVKKVDDSSFRAVLDDNNELRSLLDEYKLPKKHFKTINSGGVGKSLAIIKSSLFANT